MTESLKKKQLSCALLTNLKEHRIFDMLPVGERTKNAVETLCEWFSRIANPERIVAVVIDHNNTLWEVIQKVWPNAIVIAEKYHQINLEVTHYKAWHREHKIAVLKDLETIIKKVRKMELPDHKFSLNASEYSLLEEKMIRDHLLGIFCSVYEAENIEEAESRLIKWRTSIPNCMLSDYEDRIQVVESWWDPILALFKFNKTYTNAYTENRIRHIKRRHEEMAGCSFETLHDWVMRYSD
jgi:hypothetical protein